MTREQELAALKSQVEHLDQALQAARDRIRELESPAEGTKT
jgi:predicted  nucleic acid-binding Zn-ribbon protein